MQYKNTRYAWICQAEPTNSSRRLPLTRGWAPDYRFAQHQENTGAPPTRWVKSQESERISPWEVPSDITDGNAAADCNPSRICQVAPASSCHAHVHQEQGEELGHVVFEVPAPAQHHATSRGQPGCAAGPANPAALRLFLHHVNYC